MGAWLYLYGRCRLESETGEDMSPRRAKTKALLAYIALSSEGCVDRGRAAGLFWSRGSDPGASLRQSVKELRRCFDAFDPSLFRADKLTLSLDLSRFWVDAREARRCASGCDFQTALKLAEFSSVDLLGSLELDEPAIQEWLSVEQAGRAEDLQEALESALECVDSEATDRATLNQISHALLRMNRANERAHRALMEAYLHQGDRGSAIRQFQLCKASLAEDYGVDPSPETEALKLKIENPAVGECSTATAIQPPPGEPPGTRVDINVCQFQVAGESVELDALATEYAQGLRCSLSRFHWLSIGGRGTSPGAGPNFEIVGSILPQAGKSLVTIQLHDFLGQEILWMDRFEHGSNDSPSLVSAITDAAAMRFARAIEQAETTKAASKPIERLSPFECVLRATPLMYRLTKPSLQEAKDLLNKALEIDPNYASPYAWSAFLWSLHIGQGWAKDLEAVREEIEFLIQKAIELDPADSTTLAIAGHIDAFVHHDFETAQELFDRALESNPNSPHAWGLSAITQCYIGRPEEALRRLAKARQVMPFDPHPYYYDTARTIASSLSGRHESAAKIGHRVLRSNANFTATYRPLIASLGHLGLREDAEPLVAAAELLDPDFSIDCIRKNYPPISETHQDIFLTGLKKAGVRDS